MHFEHFRTAQIIAWFLYGDWMGAGFYSSDPERVAEQLRNVDLAEE